MQGRIARKLEARRRTLIRYVCEVGSWSSGMARPMILGGEVRVNGVVETDADRLLELDDLVNGICGVPDLPESETRKERRVRGAARRKWRREQAAARNGGK